MKTLLWYVLIALAVVVAGGAVLLLTPLGERPLKAVFAVGEVAPVDFATLEPSPDPNWFLVCPPELCAAGVRAESPIYDVPVDRLAERFRQVAAAQPRVELLAEHEDGLQLDYVQRSARFRFPDVITVRFVAVSPSQSTLALYSRALYGKGDMGVNRERVVAWLALLAEGL
jgi:uncharacterized protein (DUF1499 family)